MLNEEDASLIHIYYGDGKGKTTAAFGLALRAAGADFTVIIAQFLKGREVSEHLSLKKLDNVTLLQAELEDIFTFQMNNEQKAAALAKHNELFLRAISLCQQDHTLLVLDEIIGAISEGLIDYNIIMEFLRANGKSQTREIVLTGRCPTDELTELSDYVTEMRNVKHPYDSGVNMRKGIEF